MILKTVCRSVICDTFAASCYRVLAADTMEALLQVKISYSFSFQVSGMFSCTSTVDLADDSVCVHMSKSPIFVFEKETTTTHRDWKT